MSERKWYTNTVLQHGGANKEFCLFRSGIVGAKKEIKKSVASSATGRLHCAAGTRAIMRAYTDILRKRHNIINFF